MQPEPAHDAEVDGDDAPLLVDEQVALVHVGVEEAVAHGVTQERAQRREARAPSDRARRPQRRVIGDRDAVDPLQRQHALGRAAPVDLGHAKGAVGRSWSPAMLSAISEMAAASSRRSISISTECASVSTTATGLSRRDGGMKALDLACGEEVAVEVAPEAALDAGAQDLHRDLAAPPSSITTALCT